MRVTISFDGQNLEFGYCDEKPQRNKGHSLLEFPDEYVVVDLETTGLSPQYDEIIEICGLKIANDEVVDTYCTLVKPRNKIPRYIEELTGITNEMVKTAPTIRKALPKFINFIGNSILVAHNAHFDVNFLYDNYYDISDLEFQNDFVDTLRISRRVYPNSENYKLVTLADQLGIVYGHGHRAEEDCRVCNEIFTTCKKYALENSLDFKPKSHHSKIDVRNIVPNVTKFDLEHPLYRKLCVFTGTLNRFVRKDAMQIVVNLGGLCKDTITKDTNYLIMGIQDYSKFTDDEKSNKTKKSEQLIAAGYDLCIITEDVFYDMILDYESSQQA